jgi:DNA-binding MarR family transcriptional regulator
MGEPLNKWLKMKKSPEVREEVLLNLKVAAHFASSRMEKICSDFGITGAQYNVLRILNGVYPEGHPRCEIIARMIESAPDTTRLIDRLEKLGLVDRDRSGSDRRMSITRITAKGIKLLEKIHPVLIKLQNDLTKNLTNAECRELSAMCEKLYKDRVEG